MQEIIVYTDHKNLTCTNFNTERVMRWRLILEEYGPELRYIKGESNVVADALSRLDMIATHPPTEEEVAKLYAATANGTWAKAFPLSYAQIEDRQKRDHPLCRLLKESTPTNTKKQYLHLGTNDTL